MHSPDTVPWPWLRELTLLRHPELATPDGFGADPWQAVQRRLVGLRLLTGGDRPEFARIHRLVAAHLRARQRQGPTTPSPLEEVWHRHLNNRASQVHQTQILRCPWELDALLVTLPMMLEQALPDRMQRELAVNATFLADHVLSYRSDAEALALLRPCHLVLQRLAASDPGNAGWQRDLSVSFHKLNGLARIWEG